MTVMRTVRVVQVREVQVEAEYGDTQDTLKAKATPELLADAEVVETRVVLEELASEYATLEEYTEATEPESGALDDDEDVS